MDLGSWRIVLSLFGVISLLFSTCYCDKAPNYSFMKEATFAPQVSYYDYIIIGGGTAGCALAATLSEGAHVLLLERGGAPYGKKVVEEMSGFGANLSEDDVHNNNSTAQQFVSEDGVVSSRARVLGGGSAVNAGFYSRAGTDYVAKVGWSGSLVNESYAWIEKKVAFKPPMLQFQSAFRDGLVEAGVKPYNGFTYDHIVGTKIGGSIFDHNGKRHTAADLLEYANPNTTVVYLFATVHKIMFRTKGQYSQKPRAHGVIFRDSKGIKHKAYVKAGEMNEIILSAGALGSPQLLMLSGIGPKAHLKELGLELLVDQPMVGQGMTDNPMNAVMIPSPNPVEVSLIQAVGITEFGSYIEAASGTNFANSIIHLMPTSYKTSQPTSNQEYINKVASEKLYAGLILEKIIGPISSGHLLLKTKNPSDNPSVTFNYFKEKEDLTRCVKGMETIIKVIKSKSFSKFRYSELTIESLLTTMVNLPLNRCPRPANDTGLFTTLEQFCKQTVMTIWHYHGGCQVGRVVDKNYKVYNVSGLRVVDGSTFYASPGTNPQATVMMLGRYMGRRILQSRTAALKKKSFKD
ncbi:protein HOTHEAD-like [Chenopodium quinoa]|uniref:Glucose-methanol-choline oxidoreductase N-terminal domain-containing protein n=1 Tax=Chenopodium quinoa TaxID=63459 RepID=A0A803KXF4_CHEQI|nr:protein HOTHEAD-like [Chenopodium quinoa]